MSVRMRVTINAQDDRASELRTAADVRRDLWAHSPVEVDLDHPLRGTHRDEDGRAYFEFATEFPGEVLEPRMKHGWNTDRNSKKW